MIFAQTIDGKIYNIAETEEEKIRMENCLHGDIICTRHYYGRDYTCGKCGAGLTVKEVLKISTNNG